MAWEKQERIPRCLNFSCPAFRRLIQATADFPNFKIHYPLKKTNNKALTSFLKTTGNNNQTS